MSPLTQAAPAEPVRIDAYLQAAPEQEMSSGLTGHAEQAMLSGMGQFSTQETQFREAVQQAAAPSDTQPVAAAQESSASAGVTFKDAMQQGDALQKKSLGLMMQTYSFALEATMVTNAATTFTSSINTLIKTQ